jgi:hypothetical protein
MSEIKHYGEPACVVCSRIIPRTEELRKFCIINATNPNSERCATHVYCVPCFDTHTSQHTRCYGRSHQNYGGCRELKKVPDTNQ